MLATIGIGVFIGDRLDRHFQTETPYWTAGATLLFTIIAIYLAVRDLIRDQ